MKKPISNTFFFLFALFFVLADQAAKLIVKGVDFLGIHIEGMKLGESFEVLGSFLQITYIENEGMAFGISFGAGKIFLSLFSIFASIFLVVFLAKLKNRNNFVRLGISFILAGAAGNLIDRVFYGVIFGEKPLFYGRVVDFLQVDIPDISIMGINYTHWPIFNVADMCVTVGVIILLVFHNKIPTFSEVFRKKDIGTVENPEAEQRITNDEPKV